MKKLKFIFGILIIILISSCSSDDSSDNNLDFYPINLPKVTDGYLTTIQELENIGITIDYNQFSNQDYVNDIIDQIIVIEPTESYFFESQFHIKYSSNNFIVAFIVDYYTDFSDLEDYDDPNFVASFYDDYGRRIKWGDKPIHYGNGHLSLKKSDGYELGGDRKEYRINFSNDNMLSHYYLLSNGEIDPQEDYYYSYNQGVFDSKTGFYKVTDYFDSELNVPWLFNNSSTRIYNEIAYGFRLMKKMPKKLEEYAPSSNDDIEITHVVKDELDRVILMIAKHINLTYLTDDIVIYQYN